MRLVVIGSAAGGGFPQWNCTCANCRGVRSGRPGLRPRMQASLAVTADHERWMLFAATPDLRAQVEAMPCLWPRDGRSPITAVALPNGDLDAWVGLLSMREWSAFEIWATARVRADLVERNIALRTLERGGDQPSWKALELGAALSCSDGAFTVEAVVAPGVAPLHLRDARAVDPLDNVGFVLRDRRGGPSVGWFPSVAAPSSELERVLRGLDVLFFDGTFWADDELIEAGRSSKTARDLGHWPLSGSDGSARFIASLPASRKWLVHVNNTNPILREEGQERAQLHALGIGVAFDGLELSR